MLVALPHAVEAEGHDRGADREERRSGGAGRGDAAGVADSREAPGRGSVLDDGEVLDGLNGWWWWWFGLGGEV